MMDFLELPLDNLQAHPANSNVMPPVMLDKLIEHLRTSDQYPPLIVREFEDSYQLLDGHHRAIALRRLNKTYARCVVWEADDEQALVLLATLNRLQGCDDPRKRGALVAQLAKSYNLHELEKLLPERAEQLKALTELSRQLPTIKQPVKLKDQPVPVHFFLLPEERNALLSALDQIGPTREQALMSLVS